VRFTTSSKVNRSSFRTSADFGRFSEALEHILDMAALHLVDDVGDSRIGVRPEIRAKFNVRSS
jgi:hypothetical protein